MHVLIDHLFESTELQADFIQNPWNPHTLVRIFSSRQLMLLDTSSVIKASIFPTNRLAVSDKYTRHEETSVFRVTPNPVSDKIQK